LRSSVRSNPQLGVSASEPIGPAGERLPAETDIVPPEQLPLSGVYPVLAPMQSISASPLEVCEARIRELELMFAEMSSYTKALESRIPVSRTQSPTKKTRTSEMGPTNWP
jgi:hypothetical protein